MIIPCGRCHGSVGILTKAKIDVRDAFDYDVVLQDIRLCSRCRTDATVENARALSRRTHGDPGELTALIRTPWKS